MSHLNKQLEVNHHALEHYLEEQDRKEQLRNKLDRLGLGLMFLCGLLGLFYTTTQANSLFQKKSHNPLTQQNYATAGVPNTPQAMAPALVAKSSEDGSALKMVRISGQPVAGEKLDFFIDSFHPKAVYQFNFGNGMVKKATEEQVSFAYPQAGHYEVQLQVTFEGETQIAYSEKIHIR